MPAGAPASPGQLQVAPVPTTFDLKQQTMADGKEWLMLACHTPLGVSVYFLPPEVATKLGELLVDTGKSAGSGLVVAKQVPKAPIVVGQPGR